METKQYLIEEQNDNESETFGYLIELPSNVAEYIESVFKIICEDWGYDIMTISPSTLTKSEVELINKYCKNNYMDRLGYYELDCEKVMAIEEPEDMYDFFYKASDLTKKEC